MAVTFTKMLNIFYQLVSIPKILPAVNLPIIQPLKGYSLTRKAPSLTQPQLWAWVHSTGQWPQVAKADVSYFEQNPRM